MVDDVADEIEGNDEAEMEDSARDDTAAQGSGEPNPFFEMASDVVSAYVSNNTISPTDVPVLLKMMYNAYVEIRQAGGVRVPIPNNVLQSLGSGPSQSTFHQQAQRLQRTGPSETPETLQGQGEHEDLAAGTSTPYDGRTAAEIGQRPAVDPLKSVQRDYIICLEDGKQFKTLKRHLSTKYGMTPQQYRKKWDLADDYPVVAPSYAEHRSNMAKSLGLGQMRQKAKA